MRLRQGGIFRHQGALLFLEPTAIALMACEDPKHVRMDHAKGIIDGSERMIGGTLIANRHHPVPIQVELTDMVKQFPGESLQGLSVRLGRPVRTAAGRRRARRCLATVYLIRAVRADLPPA